MLPKLSLYLGFGFIVFMPLAGSLVYAGQVTYADNTYKSGDKLTAADLNGKFNEIKAAANDNDNRIAALEETVANLLTTISTLQKNLATATGQISGITNSNIMALDPYLTVTSAGFAKAQLSGINLQLVNGAGAESVNGLGNLVIGYDNVRAMGTPTCSNGLYTNLTECGANNEIWAISHKTGSHYLVIGNENNYSQHNGMVAGWKNTVSAIYSTVTAGQENIASGGYSTVSAGYRNIASGNSSSISGGELNKAIALRSSISGGSGNDTRGTLSSVSGGQSNSASDLYSSVSGGFSNSANNAWTSVSGGQSRAANVNYQWVAGALPPSP